MPDACAACLPVCKRPRLPVIPCHSSATHSSPCLFPPTISHQGVFHVEGKYTTRGPRLIEVNCRMVRGLKEARGCVVVMESCRDQLPHGA